MTIAFNPYFELVEIDLSDNTSIAPGGTNTQTLTPPAGFCYQIVGIYYSAPDPAGSGAGTHELNVYYDTATEYPYQLIFLQSATGSGIYIGKYASFIATTEQPTGSLQASLCYGGYIWCTNTEPILFEYDNDTDVNQTANRILRVLVKKYKQGD